MEWVEDTLPFAHCVVETKSSGGRGTSLHSRYFPQEWSNVRCARRMQSAATTGPNPSPSPSPPLTATTNPKRAAYDEVCQHYTPCFRYFFVERFGHSMQGWYTAKQQFSKSVAVSSVVGHVLGIGDRHGHNILVHERTGEVVHIDFGIVFEQGKVRASVPSNGWLPAWLPLTSCRGLLYFTGENRVAFDSSRSSAFSVDSQPAGRLGSYGHRRAVYHHGRVDIVGAPGQRERPPDNIVGGGVGSVVLVEHEPGQGPRAAAMAGGGSCYCGCCCHRRQQR